LCHRTTNTGTFFHTAANSVGYVAMTAELSSQFIYKMRSIYFKTAAAGAVLLQLGVGTGILMMHNSPGFSM